MSPRILIVEDEHSLMELLRYNFERSGYAVEVLGNGDQADARLKETVPGRSLAGLGSAGTIGDRGLPARAAITRHQEPADHHAHSPDFRIARAWLALHNSVEIGQFKQA